MVKYCCLLVVRPLIAYGGTIFAIILQGIAWLVAGTILWLLLYLRKIYVFARAP
jgi:hypothetical protein